MASRPRGHRLRELRMLSVDLGAEDGSFEQHLLQLDLIARLAFTDSIQGGDRHRLLLTLHRRISIPAL